MAKNYDHTYLIAPSGNKYGNMHCAVCSKAIDNAMQDYVVYKKPKEYDWGYRTAHRVCTNDQHGWQKIESAIQARKAKVSSLATYLLTLDDDLDVVSDLLLDAVKIAGIDIDEPDQYRS